MLDLSKIKTIVLHNRTTDRKNHITSILNKTSLQYTIFDSFPRDSHLLSGIDSLIHIYSDLLSKPFEPVLLLEDDVNITDNFKTCIEIPEGDCVYLGLSDCFCSFTYNSHTNIPKHKWISINEEIVQIRDMLSLHAYVITSRQWLEVLLDCMKCIRENPYNFDIPVARKMIDYKIYAFKYPFFYQDKIVGGQEPQTKITIDDIADKVF
jgi:hypothetical protein